MPFPFFYSVDGMLGGLSSISDIDLKGSQRFLNSLYQVVSVIFVIAIRLYESKFPSLLNAQEKKEL
jgi:hypothetical protein